MADQTITPVSASNNAVNAVVAGDYEALTAANDGVLAPPKDGKYLLFYKVTAAGGAAITVTHGDGWKSNQGDLVSGALAQNDEGIIVIDSARFKWLSGADKGKIRITVTDTVSMAAFAIP